MKYIDADLLRKEIERRKNNAPLHYHPHACTSVISELEELLASFDSLQQEQQEVDLEKFTEKMDAWKARYNYPDNIPIKGTMAFTARMFYMYPNIAREWYDSLRKVTMD